MTFDEMRLQHEAFTESVLQKLDGMTDNQYAAFCSEWMPEI